MRSWKKPVRTVSGFSCFAIELQLKCLLCVFLGAFPVSALSLILVKCVSLFSALRFLPNCAAKTVQLCLLNSEDLESRVLCAQFHLSGLHQFCASLLQFLRARVFAMQVSQSVSVSLFNERTASTALRSVVNQSKSNTCTRLASSLLVTMIKSICVWASPGSVQLHRVYSSCSEPASIQVFVTVRSSSATTACNARARKVSFVSWYRPFHVMKVCQSVKSSH